MEEERAIENKLKDDFVHVLKEKQSQEKLMEKYESMMDEMRSSKLKMRREKKHGRKGGGAQWPL